MRRVVLGMAAMLCACSGNEAKSEDGGSAGSSEGTADTAPDETSGTTTPGDPGPGPQETGSAEDDSSDETGTGDGSTGPGNEGDPVRFVLLGDGGEGNDTQFAVADIVELVCAERGCDFALYLGDNFYDVGVTSTMDQQFTDKFEMPYMDLDFPFYVVLGNHDYGTLANEWEKSAYQVEYTQYSDKWTLPNEWYDFKVENVHFIALDTSRLFWDEDVDEQEAFIRQVLAETDAEWTIAFGHHPYISNGEHGNAGNYEGLPLPIVAGYHIKDFFDAEICGKVTAYFCGHDHNRQWLQPTCGTEFIVSGAAAKTTDFEHRDGNPPARFEDDQKAGFAWVEIAGKQMTVAFYAVDGNKDFEDTITKP